MLMHSKSLLGKYRKYVKKNERHYLKDRCCNRFLPVARINFQWWSATSHSLEFAETLRVTTWFTIKPYGSSWVGLNFDIKSSFRSLHAVLSPRGSFGGLAPPDKAPSPPNWNMKHYNQLSFCQLFNVKPPRTNPKTPSRTTKPPYWKLSGNRSACMTFELKHEFELDFENLFRFRQFKTVGSIQNDIVRCSQFEAE